jgi:hypothetical protein
MWTRLPQVLLPLLITSTTPACAGLFSLGVKGGVPLTGFFNKGVSIGFGDAAFSSYTNPYIIGPTVEWRLPANLGIELNALYRHFNYNLSYTVGKDYCCLIYLVSSSPTTGGSWEFPLLLKYRLGRGIIKPYVSAGAAFDILSGVTQTIINTIVPDQRTITSRLSHPNELSNGTIEGFVAGVGADIHSVMHIAPEIRYTRWGSAHFALPGSSQLSNRNQAEFLVGITF